MRCVISNGMAAQLPCDTAFAADGRTDKAAARALGISVNTVGTHLRSIYSKLAVQSRVQLANALRDCGELN